MNTCKQHTSSITIEPQSSDSTSLWNNGDSTSDTAQEHLASRGTPKNTKMKPKEAPPLTKRVFYLDLSDKFSAKISPVISALGGVSNFCSLH